MAYLVLTMKKILTIAFIAFSLIGKGQVVSTSKTLKTTYSGYSISAVNKGFSIAMPNNARCRACTNTRAFSISFPDKKNVTQFFEAVHAFHGKDGETFLFKAGSIYYTVGVLGSNMYVSSLDGTCFLDNSEFESLQDVL